MRKISVALGLILTMAGLALADTVYMRNGSSIQGRCLGFEAGYFLFELNSGSQVKYSVRDVSRLVLNDRMPTDKVRHRRSPERREKILAISGDNAWTDTGIDLDEDVTLDIATEGQITFRRNQLVGPDGDIQYNKRDVKYPTNNSGVGALIYKIRYSNGAESSPRFIGTRSVKRIGMSEYGRLFLGINDDNVNDNTGSFTVTIRW